MKEKRNDRAMIRRQAAMLLALLMIFNGSGIQTLAESAVYSGLEFVQKTSGAEYVVESEQTTLGSEQESDVVLVAGTGEEAAEEQEDAAVAAVNAEDDGEKVSEADNDTAGKADEAEETDEGKDAENADEAEETDEGKDAENADEAEETDKGKDTENADDSEGPDGTEKDEGELNGEVPEQFSLSGGSPEGSGELVPVSIRYMKENNTAPYIYKVWDTEIRQLPSGAENVEVSPDYVWLENQEHDLHGYIKDNEPKTIAVVTEDTEVEFCLNCVRKTIKYQKAEHEVWADAEVIVILSGCQAYLPEYGGRRPGYTFIGYVDANDSSKKYQPGAQFTCDENYSSEITLEAEWETVKVNIDYYVKDSTGAAIAPSTEKAEAAAESAVGAVVTPQDGWHVLSWSGMRDGGAAITIDPGWISADKKKLTPGHTAFDAETGSYTFENSSYTVTMTENLVDIGFRGNGDGDTVEAVPSTISDVRYTGEARKIPGDEPVRVGYNFKGWSLDESGSKPWYQPGTDLYQFAKDYDEDNREVVFYAVWEAKTCQISYFDQGGAAFSGAHETGKPDTHTYGTATELKGAAKTGYTFGGWFTDPAAAATRVETLAAEGYTADIVLYAKWTPVTYTVVCDPNTPSGCTSVIRDPCTVSRIWTYDAAANGKENRLPADTHMSLNGYTFLGWFVEQDHSQGVSLGTWDTSVSDNLTAVKNDTVTLYAHWKPDENTPVLIRYWKQNLGTGTDHETDYTLAGNKSFTGTADKYQTYQPTKYLGFATPEPQTVKVRPDGTTVVDFYYDREYYSYTVAATSGVDISESSPSSGTRLLQYETPISLHATLQLPGYEWIKWAASESWAISDISAKNKNIKMPASNLTLTATAKAIEYPITYYSKLGQQAARSFEEREKEGEGTYPDSYTVETATTQISDPIPFAQPGYEFKGWNRDGSWLTTPSKAYKIYQGTTGSIDLYAMYELQQLGVSVDYTPGYSSRDGHTMTYEDLEYNVEQTTRIRVPTPADASDHFVKWRRIQGSEVTWLEPVDFELTAYDDKARFKAIWDFDFTYVPNGGTWTGGSTADLVERRPEESAITLKTDADIRKTGFHLAYGTTGWFENAALTDEFTAEEARDLKNSYATPTVYAKWEANNYKVRFHKTSGTGSMGDQAFTYDAAAKPLSASTFIRDGYTFIGWDTDPAGANVVYKDCRSVSNLTAEENGIFHLYAVWKANTYTVKFDGNGNTGGAAPSDMGYTYDAEQKLHRNTFEKTGYHFIGWAKTPAGSVLYTDEKSVKNLTAGQGATVTLYAVWEENSYTVTFNGNGSTDSKVPYKQDHTYDVSLALKANEFARKGHHLTGWASASDAPVKYADQEVVRNLTAEDNGNVDLYAVWEPNTYSVVYDGNRGGASTPVTNVDPDTHVWTYDREESLTYAPVHEGYTFTGWYDAADGTGKLGDADGTKPAEVNLTDAQGGQKTVYAHWKANTCSVKFNGNTNDGGIQVASMTYTFDQPQPLNANTFTKTGYHFTGWATDSGAAVPTWTDRQPVRNLSSAQGAQVTLYAIWAANGYTVRFNGNTNTDGKAPYTQDHTYDTAKNLKKNGFAKKGYTFIGWATGSDADVLYSDEASVLNLTSAGNGTFDLYAKWRANTYQIRYQSSTPSDCSTTVTSLDPNMYIWTVDQPETLTYAPGLEGYTFSGWYNEAGDTLLGGAGGIKGAEKNLAYEQDAAASVFAHWRANSYTVRFDCNGGTDGAAMADMPFTFDQAQTLRTNTFAKTGYTFRGWDTASDSSVGRYTDGQPVKNLTSAPGGTVTLYAIWKANTYTVTYSGNKPVSASTTVTDLDTTRYTWTYDKEATLTNAPKLEGYTFLGWYDQASGGEQLGMGGGTKAKDKNPATGAPGSTDAVVYAHWQANSYTIRFDGNGHTGGATPSDMNMTFDQAQDLNANSFARTGYAHTGWATSSAAAQSQFGNQESVRNLTSEPNGVVTMYAVWGPNTYNLHFNIAAGSTAEFENKTVIYGRTYGGGTPEGMPGAEKTGYTFRGWFTDREGGEERKVTDIVNVGHDQELYSHWTPNRYRVRFAGNGATSGSMQDQEMVYDRAATLSDSRYARKGYTFIGWATRSDAAVPGYADKEAVKNLTAAPMGTTVLYAVWSVNSYNVRFDLDGGQGQIPDQLIVFGGPVSRPGDPGRSGYSFRGWQYNGRDWNFAYDTVQEAMTLKVRWEEESDDTPVNPGPYSRPTGGVQKVKRGHWELRNEERRMWKYHFDDGTCAAGGWYYLDNEYTKTPGNEYTWFFFGKDEYMQWGWILADDLYSWYYTDVLSNGDLGAWWRGWLDDPQDGHRYFLDRDTGVMYTGWHTIDGKEYYFETVGNEAGKAWYLDIIDPTTGYKVWLCRNSSLHPLGSMYRSEMTPDGHFVDENGVKVR